MVQYSGVSDRTKKKVPFSNPLRFNNNHLYKEFLYKKLIPLEKIYNFISRIFINKCRFEYSISWGAAKLY